MENVRPLQYSEPAYADPTRCSNSNCSTSTRDLPLLEQDSPSECSATQDSIGSSSDFNVRTLPDNPMPTVAEAAEPSRSNSTTPVSRRHGGWDIADPPMQLTPRNEWVPAEAVFEADNGPAYSTNSNDSVLPEVINDNQVPELTDGIEPADEGPPQVTPRDSAPPVVNEESGEPSSLSITPKISNSTTPSYGQLADIEPPDEEKYRLQQIANPCGPDWEVFDLPKISRARLYQYYICRVRKLKVLCEQAQDMTDLSVHSEEDYELLRTLTRTNWGTRWWTIMIDDLRCPECVVLLRASRLEPKSKYRKAWLKIKNKIKQICRHGDNGNDFVCHHTRPKMNRVTRFFHTLGEENASRMVNIEFDTDPNFPVDIDVLASAVYNAGKYFKDIQRISIKFHFPETVAIEREHMKGIVRSLEKLEGILPRGHKLHVAGFEDRDEFHMAWAKKSRARKWWMK